MSRSYPIWNEITSCKYNSNKSYGVVETGVNEIKIGSGSKNSRNFLKTIITKRSGVYKGKNVVIFRFSVDDVVLKTAIFEEKRDGTAGKFIKEVSKLNRMKSLKIEGLSQGY